ncbi:helix-turn-helix domain-containing protein [Actinoplanes sp. NPDC026670]|uniref:helix-turn-helix transcriptional regulator n=1 Tax=Actinoplanes sp. NPDC026670 TaxID=3154700 RepID=UPI0033FC22C1
MSAWKVGRFVIILALGVGAGWISLGHVYEFVMEHSAAGTHPSTGIIVAAVSELMPLGVAVHARLEGRFSGWAIALLLLAGGFSLWAQIATADPGVAGYAVAAFPTLAFMALIKLVMGGHEVEQAEPHAAVQLGPIPATVTKVATPPAWGVSANDGRESGSGSAAITGEVAAEPDVSATPTSPAAKKSGDSRPRRSASRAQTAAKIRAVRHELEAELGRKVTQSEVAKKVGCSTATVSRAESGKTNLSLAA